MKLKELGELALTSERRLRRYLDVERPEAVPTQHVLVSQLTDVVGDELGPQCPALDRDVPARTLDAEPGEPQAIDGLAGKRTEILRHALCIAQSAAVQHGHDFTAPGQHRVHA